MTAALPKVKIHIYSLKQSINIKWDFKVHVTQGKLNFYDESEILLLKNDGWISENGPISRHNCNCIRWHFFLLPDEFLQLPLTESPYGVFSPSDVPHSERCSSGPTIVFPRKRQLQRGLLLVALQSNRASFFLFPSITATEIYAVIVVVPEKIVGKGVA
jgi:hypothetical protein